MSNAVVPLREMLQHAVEWGYLTANPAIGLRRPRISQRNEETQQPLEAEHVRRLLEAAEAGLERTLLLTAVTTGMRRGEVLGLQWRDIDRERGRVWVRRSIGRDGSAQTPKSRRSTRAIGMAPTLSAALAKHQLASRFKQPTDYVFTTRTGRPLEGRNVSRMFRATLRRAGLPLIRFHDLRHTYASLLVLENAHPKFISEQLGHASVQITIDRYSHLFDQSYSDESAKLEQALFGQVVALDREARQ